MIKHESAIMNEASSLSYNLRMNGTVRVGGIVVNEIRRSENSATRPDDKATGDANYATTNVYGSGHPLCYENVIKTIRGNEKAKTAGRNNLKALDLLVALYLSEHAGRRVALP
jgi:UDP-N-acetyl-2-amino-2-deoxyglucuronate dehydrogenase